MWRCCNATFWASWLCSCFDREHLQVFQTDCVTKPKPMYHAPREKSRRPILTRWKVTAGPPNFENMPYNPPYWACNPNDGLFISPLPLTREEHHTVAGYKRHYMLEATKPSMVGQQMLARGTRNSSDETKHHSQEATPRIAGEFFDQNSC